MIILDIVHHLRPKRPAVFQVLDLLPGERELGK
jgi:hypothetical protein